jgi:transcription initiation factor TFIID TATA-box-binding protein
MCVSLGLVYPIRLARSHVSVYFYIPQSISAVIMRLPEPRATAMLFMSGKMLVSGTKDEDTTKQAAKVFAKRVKEALRLSEEASNHTSANRAWRKTNPVSTRETWKLVRFADFKIHNIVGAIDMRHRIHIDNFTLHMQHLNDPKMFPDSDGLDTCEMHAHKPLAIYHMTSPKVTLLIFHTGKIVLTGATQVPDMKDAFDFLHGYLTLHKL